MDSNPLDEFGLTPKHECQVDCPVLKAIYEGFKRREQSLWRDVDSDKHSPEFALAPLRARAAVYSELCLELALAFSPKAMAGLLKSMGEEEEIDGEEYENRESPV